MNILWVWYAFIINLSDHHIGNSCISFKDSWQFGLTFSCSGNWGFLWAWTKLWAGHCFFWTSCWSFPRWRDDNSCKPVQTKDCTLCCSDGTVSHPLQNKHFFKRLYDINMLLNWYLIWLECGFFLPWPISLCMIPWFTFVFIFLIPYHGLGCFWRIVLFFFLFKNG